MYFMSYAHIDYVLGSHIRRRIQKRGTIQGAALNTVLLKEILLKTQLERDRVRKVTPETLHTRDLDRKEDIYTILNTDGGSTMLFE